MPASAWYFNPVTNHYQYAAADPGSPWILQSPTITLPVSSTTVTPTSGSTAGGD
jgi:hypothetical protein